jgi:uroporphyrinogen decarboxylase
MTEMTPRERVLTALNREVPDRVPFELSFGGFTPPLMETFVARTGSTDPASYWGFPVRSVGLRGEPQYELWRRYSAYYPTELPVGTGISGFGGASKPGSTLHFARAIHPLKNASSVDDVAAYPLPDPTPPARYAHLEAEVEGLHAANLAAQGDLYCTLFESAWGIRGFEEMLSDFILNPEMVEVLLDRLTQLRVVQAKQLAEAGIDVLRLGDDIGKQNGMLMSPDTWRTWLKPRLARVIGAAREANPEIHVFYHSDGDCRAVIPDLVEIGVTVLNPVQPECMDPVELKNAFGDRLAFWGTVGTQTTMPFGTTEDVRSTVKERIETVGKGGGLLIAPTHVLEPEVPWENVVAFIDAVREYGAAD